MNQSNFHISLPCNDLEATVKFYCEELGCSTGRSAHHWTDINLHGNQLTFIRTGAFKFPDKHYGFQNSILPVFHFGVLLRTEKWIALNADYAMKNVISIEPINFLQGQTGEHRSFFVEDPNGYLIEFKTFSNPEHCFKSS